MIIRNLIFCLFSFFILTNVFAQKKLVVNKPYKKIQSKEWVSLLDKDLSQWEIWTGVPHETVKNLPKSYKVPQDGKPIEPIGLDNSLKIYTTSIDENGDVVLNISGQVYAGLTSKKDYENYHLTLLFKWGEKKYEPRLNRERDNGLLYHCYGDHGAFWKVWKRCLELQIQERDFGDLYTLAGTKATTNTIVAKDGKNRWNKNGKPSEGGKRGVNAESCYGAWTRVDLYTIGDKAIHVVNGEVVMAIYNAKNHKGEALTSGQIQIQSESAESYVKDIAIRPIKKFPRKLKRAAGF